MIGKDKIFSTLSQVLKKSPSEQTEAVFIGTSTGLTRFANSYIHQNVFEISGQVFFRVALGRKLGVVSTTSLVKEDLDRALLTAYHIAENQPETPGFNGFAPKAKYEKIRTHYPSTASFTPVQRAEKIMRVFKIADKKGFTVAGSLATGESEVAVLNTNGVEAYQPFTSAATNMTVMGDNSSGYSEALSREIRKIDFTELGEIATKKCMDSKDPQELPPGKYTVILEPKAVAEILEWMNYTGFGAQSVEDGTGFLHERSGKKIMGDNITIYDDALDTNGMAAPFDFEGVPKKKVYFVKKGIGGDVVYNRIAANKAGTKPTGHGLPPGSGSSSFSLNTFVASGRNTLNSMISNTDKGILVTRFHYINGLIDTRNAVMTGMTRDGTFLVKNGKIAEGIKNLRFTENMLKAFSRVKMISKEQQAINTWWSDVGCVVAPAIMISNFNFSGKTEF
ncbi:MAG: TldD/PmbA family protein [candidate division Zixibacteria bacterium]|nr:TldD/PmbA family protein [candidate division Zixibacteria bacterium]